MEKASSFAVGSTYRLGNHEFELSERHITVTDLWELKQQYDQVSSDALLELQSFAQANTPGTRLDLYALLLEHHASDTTLQTLWNSVSIVPDWVDWGQLERGQRVFYRYGAANLIGFALQGFMGENAATPSISEVLVRTGGFSTSVVLRRAIETFQWLLEVTRSIDDIKPGGHGHVSTVRIRLLHASVRQRMQRLRESKPNYFDTAQFGEPVNLLDDIHSIALFACNPIWLQLPVMGIHLRQDEVADYIALFRYLGHLLAIPDHYFANVTVAKETMEATCLYERQPTPTSQVLCHNFIAALKDVPPFNISAGFVEAGARLVNGDELSDAEGIARPGIISHIQFRGFCWFVQILAFFQRAIPSFDAFVIDLQRRLLYSYMVEGSGSKFNLGGPSKFEMKYQPSVDRMTTKEASTDGKSAAWLMIRPLESLCMIVFFSVCAVGTGGGIAACLLLRLMVQALL